MSSPIITVENLGKKYRLGQRAEGMGYTSLREVIARSVSTVRGKSLTKPKSTSDAFWALRDVSFTVNTGDVLGIIGRNGAGKSTLLKILSRITEPSTGRAVLRGRVASLLEVGTGFHPELTGRENIYLNGAILGMSNVEIRSKFDAIVDFSEVEKFLETPVKRYSSGMYVRLAFAVAAHLEPEILVVDEVLAVGDAVFQKKCLAKMNSVAASGRTILFVSHNIGAVRSLCRSAVWLEAGSVKMVGAAEEVTAQFMSGGDTGTASQLQHRGSGEMRIERIGTTNLSRELQAVFLVEEPIRLSMDFSVVAPIRASFWFFVATEEGVVILSSFQKDSDAPVLHSEDGVASVVIDSPSLLPGTYILTVGAFAADGSVIDWVDGASRFEVLRHFADGRSFDFRYGIVTQRLAWAVEPKCSRDTVYI